MKSWAYINPRAGKLGKFIKRFSMSQSQRQNSTIFTRERLLQLKSYKDLEHSWYFLAAATLSVCNKPQEIPKIFHLALLSDDCDPEQCIANSEILEQLSATGETPQTLSSKLASPFVSSTEQAKIAKQTREALLKSAALAGLPRAINSLMLLKNCTPIELRETEKLRDGINSISSEQELQRGLQFWDVVYGKVSKRVKGQMETSYPDLLSWTLKHVYSPLLSYTGVLSAKESSLVVIACLVPQNVNPQLKGHLKGALNNNASLEEIRSARQLAIDIAEWCGIEFQEPVAKL